MAIIDPEGLFHGERLAACSDIAQLWWPRFFVASNGYARMELSYVAIISKIFGSLRKAPEAEEIWAVFEEYSHNCLAVLYEHEGVWWAQFDTSQKYLPRFKTVRDEKSPHPPNELMEKHRSAYLTWKSNNSVKNESFRKSAEDFGTFLQERGGVGVGVGGGVGVGEEKITPEKPKASAKAVIELPVWVDPELWEQYLDVRKKRRAVMTERAFRGIWNRLEELSAKGYDRMELLANSVRSNWIDIYEPKSGGTNGTRAGNAAASSTQVVQTRRGILDRRSARRVANGHDYAGGDPEARVAGDERFVAGTVIDLVLRNP